MPLQNECFSGVYFSQPVCPPVYQSVCVSVQNTTFCHSAGGGYQVTFNDSSSLTSWRLTLWSCQKPTYSNHGLPASRADCSIVYSLPHNHDFNNSFRKNCGKRRPAFSPFPTMFCNPSQNKFQFFSHIYLAICKFFQFGPH